MTARSTSHITPRTTSPQTQDANPRKRTKGSYYEQGDDWENDEDAATLHCPEQALWRAVITQALMDASSQCKKSSSQRAREEAIIWLQGNTADFREVCENAGFEPDYIRKQAAEALKRGCVWRKDSKESYSDPKKARKITKNQKNLQKKEQNPAPTPLQQDRFHRSRYSFIPQNPIQSSKKAIMSTSLLPTELKFDRYIHHR